MDADLAFDIVLAVVAGALLGLMAAAAIGSL